jgi:hypothetical protein
VPNPHIIVCPDYDHSDETIQPVMEHMTSQHQEIVLTVLEDRERRFQERMKAHLQRNPPKRPEGNFHFTRAPPISPLFLYHPLTLR